VKHYDEMQNYALEKQQAPALEPEAFQQKGFMGKNVWTHLSDLTPVVNFLTGLSW
jgi:hypothetical protein